MENWIGIAVWVVLGAVVGLAMRAVIRRPEETSGHAMVIAVLGAFGAVVGGMLGVGIFHLDDPMALSAGGMGGALFLSVLAAGIYRWGVRGLV